MNRFRSIAPSTAFIGFGHVLFAALCVLAFIHRELRVIHVDSAYQIFKWINNEGLQIEAHRYSAILPQLCVKLGKAVGVSLRTLVLVASVAHVLVPWAIFGIIAHGLKKHWMAMAVAICAVVCTRLTFYGIVLEANYLLCYPLLFAAELECYRERVTVARSFLLFLSLALVLFVHPLGALIALFVVVMRFASGDRHRSIGALGVACIVWLCVSRFIFPPTGYEQNVYGGMSTGWASITGAGVQPALDFFFGHTWGHTT
ncbi:MAG TPA: hypothetical protein PK760_15350, partial [Flavobacteriales bacterium]|nr:hypothetical protein [Flavobacteriales bacterium]